jgi:archaellin
VSAEPDVGPYTLVYEAEGGTPTGRTFTVSDNKDIIEPGERARLTISPYIPDVGGAGTPCTQVVGQGQWFTLEVKPKNGASVLISQKLSNGYSGVRIS